MSRRTRIRLKAGEMLGRVPNRPTLTVTPAARGGNRKRDVYLWIGNDAPDDKFCFAHVGGEATLRRLAKAILAEVGDED